MKVYHSKSECDRCGTCCMKGGPALHYDDKKLLQSNQLNPDQLITIRKGEPIYLTASEKPEPARSEIVKIKGKGDDWACLFFAEKENKCAIYKNRPLECVLLKCWDTTDLENVAGKSLLNRRDIIETDDPIIAFISSHDEKCSLENLFQLVSGLQRNNSHKQSLHDLTVMANTDLAHRMHACERFQLSLERELFFFGRPLFKILNQFGITTHITNGLCRLSC